MSETEYLSSIAYWLNEVDSRLIEVRDHLDGVKEQLVTANLIAALELRLIGDDRELVIAAVLDRLRIGDLVEGYLDQDEG